MYEEKRSKSAVSVSLSANNFDGNSYIVRIKKNKVNLEHIVSDISANYPSLDPYVINHAAELIKDQIIKYLREGRAVDILELGTLYPAAKGTIKKTNPQVSDLPEFTARFKPSKLAVSAVASVSAESFMLQSPEPSISRVISLKDGSEGELFKGFPARIKGDQLKITGEKGGVFLVPPDGSGLPDKNEENWISAGTEFLIRNAPKTLEFNIPDAAEEGRLYFIAVRTSFCRSYIPRKDVVTGFSPSAAFIRA